MSTTIIAGIGNKNADAEAYNSAGIAADNILLISPQSTLSVWEYNKRSTYYHSNLKSQVTRSNSDSGTWKAVTEDLRPNYSNNNDSRKQELVLNGFDNSDSMIDNSDEDNFSNRLSRRRSKSHGSIDSTVPVVSMKQEYLAGNSEDNRNNNIIGVEVEKATDSASEMVDNGEVRKTVPTVCRSLLNVLLHNRLVTFQTYSDEGLRKYMKYIKDYEINN